MKRGRQPRHGRHTAFSTRSVPRIQEDGWQARTPKARRERSRPESDEEASEQTGAEVQSCWDGKHDGYKKGGGSFVPYGTQRIVFSFFFCLLIFFFKIGHSNLQAFLCEEGHIVALVQIYPPCGFEYPGYHLRAPPLIHLLL